MLAIRNPNTSPTSRNKKWLVIGLGLAATSALSFFGFQYWKKRRSITQENSEIPEMPEPKKPIKPKAKKKTSQPKAKINAVQTAKDLNTALKKKDYKKVMALLGTIKSVADYTAVNKNFSGMVLNGVKQTIVNGVLSTFKDEKEKAAIRLAFTSMGLKYDGKKWGLQGIENLIITNRKTKVWKDPKTSVNVPANMVLGEEITERGNFKVFKSGSQLFLVESKHVNKYNN